MWRQNLLLVFRNFRRNKTTSLINIIGLSTSLACVFLIGLWIADEYRVDRFHDEEHTVFQVMQNINRNANDVLTWEWTPGILAQTLREEFPEVEHAIQVTNLGGYGIIEQEGKYFKASEYYADAPFFEVFAFPLLAGDPTAVLQRKNEVVISDELAAKLFNGTDEAIGKTINWQRSWADVSGDYVVSGVFAATDATSTLDFDLLFNYSLFFDNKPSLKHWRNSDPYTFVTLKPATNHEMFSLKIRDLIQQKEEDSSSTLFLRPFADRYLFANYENGEQAGGRISYIRILGLIALLVLIIACINFMNLSTAQASLRQKEVALKKIVGVKKGALIGQFMTEALVFTGLSAILALGLVHFSLPFFNALAEKQLILSADPSILLPLSGILLVTALLAGSYPAFYLSGLPALNLLGRPSRTGRSSAWVRKSLVTLQFTLSMLLILGMLVVYQQLDFLQNKDLGYNQENILLFRKEGPIREKTEAFLAELNELPGVQQVSTLDNTMTGNYGYTTSVDWDEKDPAADPIRFSVMAAGEELIETLGIQVKEGRSYAGHFQAPGRQLILNEAAIKAIGYQNPIGRTIERRGDAYQIVGVVEDFHFESLTEAIKPCIIERSAAGRQVVMKVAASQTAEVITKVEELHARMNPGYPFEYQFLDEKYAQLYVSESRIAVLSRCFAGLAILLSCLGLFGLTAFTIERRSKEISIRKILGSSVTSIIRLLSRELLVLMTLAIVLAVPIGWYFAQDWLQSFAFRISLGVSLFGWAALLALGLGMLTILWQGLKAALANPIDALRNE